MERGRAAAIASIVASWKTMKAEISSCFARAVRQARSALDNGNRSLGSGRVRGDCPLVDPVPAAARDMT